ncbi:MAG: nicotinamide mononucleotide transporter [Ruminococcaceae bacterium]|nr:nicotinamide mononucleotide transporter [Oscillospiraceae bacterium]
MKAWRLNFRMWMLLITGALIAATGIYFGQEFLHILPLFISLFVMLLQTQANRYAFLLGGLNSMLYSVVYIAMQLYANAVYSFLFSGCLQIITFFNWKKHAYGKSTVLRRLTNPQRWMVAGIFLVGWVGLNLALSGTDASLAKRLLDNASSVLGTITTFVSMLSFMEYPALQLISAIIGFPMYFILLMEDPAQTTFFIYHIYSTICVCLSLRTVRALYSYQQEERNHID